MVRTIMRLEEEEEEEEEEEVVEFSVRRPRGHNPLIWTAINV